MLTIYCGHLRIKLVSNLLGGSLPVSRTLRVNGGNASLGCMCNGSLFDDR